MFSDNSIFLFLTLCSMSLEVQSLVELPTEDENDIAYTEAVIRDAIKNIFITLRIRDVRTKPRLKEYSIIHNYLVSITLKDSDYLKEIERLSRVYDINNERNFITEINDILSEKDESDVLTDNNNVTMYTAETFINKIRYLKDIYKLQNTMSSSEINPEILNHIINDESIMDYSNVTILSVNPFRVPKVDRRVYHGHRADIKTFPFMASIHVFNKFRCAGSVIKNDVIITSSTCLGTVHNRDFLRKSPAYLSVRVGSSYVDSGGEMIGVHALHFHPRYNPSTLMHNIAVIKLSRPAIYGMLANTVKRVLIDQSPTPMSDHANEIVVLGFGYKSDSDYKLHRISYSVLDVYPKRRCQKVYGKKYFTNHHFCGTLAPKKGGACQKDIGGPGIVEGKLVGIINYASDSCGDKPTVFTKVGYYAKWILEVVGKEGSYIGIPIKRKTAKRKIHVKHSLGRTAAETTTQATTTAAADAGDDFVNIFTGFQDFISNIFSRAQDDTTSNENVTNEKPVIHILN